MNIIQFNTFYERDELVKDMMMIIKRKNGDVYR